MKKCHCLTALLLLLSANMAGANEIVTNDTVLQMVRLQLGDDLIVKKIQASICQFETSPEGLVKLKNAGVSQSVISAMITAGGSSNPSTGAGSEKFGAATATGFEPWASIAVRMEHSNPRRWVPFYGGYSSGQNTYSIAGAESKRRFTNKRPAFVTSIDPSRLKLVQLSLNRHGDRYVVFAESKSDRELQFTSDSIGSGSSWKLLPANDQPEGEYGWLVSPPPREGSSGGWFVAFTAYDFAITK